MTLNRKFFFLISILLLAIFLRVYKLDEIPAEMWGDIVEGYKFTQYILEGKWPFYFVLGNGPLFFYIAAFLSLFLGLSFMVLKLTSTLVGVILIIGSYLLAQEIAGKWVALLTAYLLAVSKWPLIYSHLGNMNILVPAFVVFIFYYLIRALRTGKTRYFLITGILTGIGMYNYPAFLFVPATLAIIFFYLVLFQRHFIVKNFNKILLGSLIFVLLCLPFFRMSSQFGFFNSKTYFGSKLFVADGQLPSDFVSRLITNLRNSFGIFHIRGDSIFRVNPKNEPHLDVLSGIFLLLGIFYFFKKKELQKNAVFILLPLVILQLPAILVVNYPGEVPSATRAIGILPFLYLSIAVGIYYFVQMLKRFGSIIFILLVLILIFAFNFKSVFIDYPNGLPNKNTPFGKIIAKEIDKLPHQTKVYIIGCCWGDWGQPEPGGIIYVTKTKRLIKFFSAHDNLRDFKCEENLELKKDRQAYYVVNPSFREKQVEVKECVPGGEEEMIHVDGFDVAWIYKVGF